MRAVLQSSEGSNWSGGSTALTPQVTTSASWTVLGPMSRILISKIRSPLVRYGGRRTLKWTPWLVHVCNELRVASPTPIAPINTPIIPIASATDPG